MTRVIGLGSPFGDDKAGWRVIEILRGKTPASVELLALDRPGAGLISWFDDTDHLVIVDAMVGARTDRPFVEIDPETVRSTELATMSGHDLNLNQTIALAKVLGVLPRRLEIYGIPVTPTGIADDDRTEGKASVLAAYLSKQLSDCNLVPDQVPDE